MVLRWSLPPSIQYPVNNCQHWNRVIVVSFTWDDMPECKVAAEPLMNVFEQEYGYQVHRVLLPSGEGDKLPNDIFLEELIKVDRGIAPREDNILFIVHYLGHGADVKETAWILDKDKDDWNWNLFRNRREIEHPGNAIWHNKGETSAGPNIVAMEQGVRLWQFKRAKVIWLLDCPTPSVVSSYGGPRNWMIAASVTANATESTSHMGRFTQNIADILMTNKRLGCNVMTVSGLYHHLMDRYENSQESEKPLPKPMLSQHYAPRQDVSLHPNPVLRNTWRFEPRE